MDITEYNAKTWEERAAMWHDKYREMVHLEREHARYKDALERIAKGTANAPRCAAMAQSALRIGPFER